MIQLATRQQLSTFRAEQRAAAETGNLFLSTSAGLRLAVSTGSASVVAEYLLNQMGIGANVVPSKTGLAIAVKTQQAFNAIHSALRGSFAVATAMTQDGRTALHINAI